MSLWRKWQDERTLRRRAAAFVGVLERDPEDSDVRWLAAHGTQGDADHARWELRYARRAIGLLVAERDALDDRTASVVAGALQEALDRDRNVAAAKRPVARQQLNERLRVYADALKQREAGLSSGERLGRVLLRFAGAGEGERAAVARAGELIASYMGQANEALRREFGDASLPEDVPPSAAR